jgi:hypothetical protein
MSRDKDEKKPVSNEQVNSKLSSADIKNAHAAGDGALEKSDESIDKNGANKEEVKNDPAY